MEVHEVSNISGVSIRTLQYYDSIDLLKPSGYTESGYRLYDENSLEKLQQIMLFKELEFPLKEIKKIIDAPNFDKEKALEQQIKLLTLKKERIEKLIEFAKGIKVFGERETVFNAFDTSKIEAYKKQAKEQWGDTEAYKENEEKSKKRTSQEEQIISDGLMIIFLEFGKMKNLDITSETVQSQVNKLQSYITENYYKCTKEILSGLGQMYVAGGEFTENIDNVGGEGTAEFTARAIEYFCM